MVSESELIKLERSFKSNTVPYLSIKGNHDENDKFDEHHDLKASFPQNEFENIMWPDMYHQKNIKYISRQHGVAYFDFDDVRVISVNTSDLPYVLNNRGQKKYDAKITLAVREDQIEEIIEILARSSNKRIVFMSHANPINRKGSNALKYNGRSLHELLVAFNQREREECTPAMVNQQNFVYLTISILLVLKMRELWHIYAVTVIVKINTVLMASNIFYLIVQR